MIIAQCPNASINSSTGEPVSKQVVYDILENRCYDIDPSIPWSHQKLLAKSAVLPQDMPKRLAFGNCMLSLRHTPHWYWRRVVWADICNSVLPTTIRKANAQALAHTSAEGGCWMDVRGCEARPCQHARQEAGLGPRWEGVFASILDANSCARQAPPRSLGGGLSWRPRQWYVSLRPYAQGVYQHSLPLSATHDSLCGPRWRVLSGWHYHIGVQDGFAHIFESESRVIQGENPGGSGWKPRWIRVDPGGSGWIRTEMRSKKV